MFSVSHITLAALLVVGGSLASSDSTTPTCEIDSTLALLGGANSAPFCPDPPSQVLPCAGATTVFTIDGSAAFDPDGDSFTFEWLGCPGSVIADSSATITTITLDTSSNCNLVCGVRLRLTDSHGAIFVCRTFLQVVPGTEGCSPGYWKQHPEAWATTGFSPTDDYDTVFGVNAFTPDRTLMVALQTGGGGLNKLGRMSVSSLLSATHMGVAFPLSISQVLNLTKAAILAGAYEPLASTLAVYAGLPCPID